MLDRRKVVLNGVSEIKIRNKTEIKEPSIQSKLRKEKNKERKEKQT